MNYEKSSLNELSAVDEQDVQKTQLEDLRLVGNPLSLIVSPLYDNLSSFPGVRDWSRSDDSFP